MGGSVPALDGLVRSAAALVKAAPFLIWVLAFLPALIGIKKASFWAAVVGLIFSIATVVAIDVGGVDAASNIWLFGLLAAWMLGTKREVIRHAERRHREVLAAIGGAPSKGAAAVAMGSRAAVDQDADRAFTM